MPELISAPGNYQMERGWGVFKPLLDPSNERGYQVIDTLVGEMAVMDRWSSVSVGTLQHAQREQQMQWS